MSPLRDWKATTPPVTRAVSKAAMMVTARIGSIQRRHQGFSGFGPTGAATAGVCCSDFDVGVPEVMVQACGQGLPTWFPQVSGCGYS